MVCSLIPQKIYVGPPNEINANVDASEDFMVFNFLDSPNEKNADFDVSEDFTIFNCGPPPTLIYKPLRQ